MARAFTLKGIITFLDKGATATIKRVDREVVRFSKNTRRIGAGVRQMNMGLATLGAGGAAAGLGLAKAVKISADFEQQIARVNAIFGGLDTEGLRMAEEATKALGASTEFTAKQAGQGLEFLALAGFKVEDAVSVLPTILDTAAAGGLELGRASDIITDSMSALGAAFDANETKQERAIRLADMMALVQSKANTNIEQLGEAIKFGGGTLTGFGVPLEQTIAALGKLADAGLKGSIGGTSLQNMFNKLVKPSKKATEFMNKFGVTTENLPLDDIPKLTAMFKNMLGTIANENERGALAVELFGLRGIKAYNSLANAGREAGDELVGSLKAATGTSRKMAEIQRATFSSQVKMLRSAVEGTLIEIGNFFIKGEKSLLPFLTSFTAFIQDIAGAFQFLSGNVKGFSDEMEKVSDPFAGGMSTISEFEKEMNALHGTSEQVVDSAKSFNDELDEWDDSLNRLSPRRRALIEFARGFKEGIQEAFRTAKNAFDKIRSLMGALLPEGADNIQNLGRMIAKFTVLAAVVAPLILAFVAFSFAANQVGGMFLGLGKIVTGTMGIFAQFFGLMGLNKKRLKKGFKSFFTFMGKGFKLIGKAAMGLGRLALPILTKAMGVLGKGAMTLVRVALIPLKFAIMAVGKALLLLVANPVGAIIAAVVAVGVAIFLLIKHWDSVKAATIEAWTSINDFIITTANQIKAFLLPIWNGMKDFLVGSMGETGLLIIGIVEAWWQGVTNVFMLGVTTLKGIIEFFGALLTGEFGRAGEIAGGLVANFVNFVMNQLAIMTDIGSTLLTAFGEMFKGGWDWAVESAKTVWNGFIEWLSSITLDNVLQKLFLDPINAIFKKLMGAFEFIKNLSVNDVLEKGSDLFSGFMKGFNEGIANNEGAAALEGGIVQQSIDAERRRQGLPTPVVDQAPAADERLPQRSKAVNAARSEQSGLGAQSFDFGPGPQTEAPPVNANITVVSKIDGHEVARAVAKQQITNSERLGQSLSPKTRNRLGTNGGFAGQAG